MSDYLINQFEQEETQRIFQKICEQKARIHELIGDYLAEEEAFKGFIAQHEMRFQAMDTKKRNLEVLIRNTQERLRWDELEDPSVLAADQPITESELSLPDLPDLPLEPKPPEGNWEFLDLDDSDSAQFNIEQEPQFSIPIPSKSTRDVVEIAFRWIYHPRTTDMNTPFYQERTHILNLLRDRHLDEVDLLMRMPFEAEDQRLWCSPISKRNQDAGQEDIRDLWYRLKFWSWLLDQGISRAQWIANSPHEMYPEFLEYKKSGKNVIHYFQEVEFNKLKEIEYLELQLAELQAKAVERELRHE